MKHFQQPAFPESIADGPFGGMTLRDYFAAKAMQAIITLTTNLSQSYFSGDSGNTIALDAYIMADAMLKAREASE